MNVRSHQYAPTKCMQHAQQFASASRESNRPKADHKTQWTGPSQHSTAGTPIPQILFSLIMLLTVLLLPSASLANTPATASVTEPIKHFNIPRQRADDALTAFGQQADITVVYQYDSVKHHHTNQLKGDYRLTHAVAILLDNTSLKAEFDSASHLIITNSNQSKGKSMNTTNGSKRKTLLATLVGVLGAGGAATSMAQVDEAATGQSRIDEIIVTATKRQASMQDLPMSINAFGSDELDASSVIDIKDIQFLAAGTQIGGNRLGTNITIRGVGGDFAAPGTSSGVAVHMDGVYLSEKALLGRALFDVERIEVLRGPQGTLYGRNATGGSLNIISNAPNHEEKGALKISTGNYSLVQTEAYINGGLGDNTAARIAIKTVKRDGFTENTFGSNELDNADSKAIRASLLFEPDNDFSLKVVADYIDDKSTPVPINSRGLSSTPTLGESLGGTFPIGRARNSDITDIQEIDAWGLNIRADWNLGDIKLTSITGYRDTEWAFQIDGDGTDANAVFSNETKKIEQITQEINLTSNSDSSLQWILGAFYFKEDVFQQFIIPIPAFGDFTFVGATPDLQTKAYAAFGELSYLVTENLSMTFGARYSVEEKYMDEFGGFIGAFSFDTLSDDWNSFTPKISALYSISDDIKLYASIGRGFKAGGFNGTVLQGESFDPEKITSYEIGLKGMLNDGQVRLNAAVFYMDYEDLQVQVQKTHPVSGIALVSIDNAAVATISGFELELEAQMTEGLTIDGNISYLDTEYDEYSTVDNTRGDAIFDVSGNPLQSAPKVSANLGIQYANNIPEIGGVSVRAEYSYQDDISFSPFNDALRIQPSNYRVNLKMSLKSIDEKWDFAVFGKNLTDERTAEYLNIQGAFLGFIKREFLLPPRTYGVSVGYTF